VDWVAVDIVHPATAMDMFRVLTQQGKREPIAGSTGTGFCCQWCCRQHSLFPGWWRNVTQIDHCVESLLDTGTGIRCADRPQLIMTDVFADCSGVSKRMSGTKKILECIVVLLVPVEPLQATDNSLELVRTETWTEFWLDSNGNAQRRDVTGEIWTDAFQMALDERKLVSIPAREQPYYLDGPLVLRSGDSIKADPDAEIRLVPGTNTCMVRNENIVGFADQAVPRGLQPDTDIVVEGGIWTTLATSKKEANGNLRGRSAKGNPVPNTHGVILLHNVSRIAVRDITIRQSKAFGVHLGNVTDFVVDGVTLDRHRRDGVHVNGPASHGIIRNVGGTSHDDTVALNAWEWQNYAPSFGPIHHVRIERIAGSVADGPSANSIRLLPGVKQFADGKTLDCSIHDISLKQLTDIREFKLYDQPNLEQGRDKDFSLVPGKLRDIRIQGLTLTRPGVIKVAADVERLTVEDVDLQFAPAISFKLVEIGPMSMTWRASTDPSNWVEVFSPDRDVTVRGFALRNVRVNAAVVSDPSTRFLQVQDQKLNPEYPQTTPRGGTGKALLIP